jgi:crossover junction endodeoxyribonuclease RuvC
MKLISIDPGYERLGIAIIEKNGTKKESLIFSECFQTSAKENHAERLSQIQIRLSELIQKYSPKILAIETLFFNQNVKTALLVAEARGLIIGTAKSAGVEVFEYSPQQIKVAVTGHGASDKTAISKMIPLLIGVEKEIKHDDEYDAIACGLTHFANKQIN